MNMNKCGKQSSLLHCLALLQIMLLALLTVSPHVLADEKLDQAVIIARPT